LNPIIKPWPSRGWGIDLIGQINPPSSKGHKFVLLATDYFTQWVEAIPLKKVTSENMIEFVKEHIIYRFGIPQTITTDQRAQFVSLEFREFAVGGIRNQAFRTLKIKECFSRSGSRAKGPAAKSQEPLNLFSFFRIRLSA
jgi:hypothetical protein